MSRITPFRGLLMNLHGEIPQSRRRAFLPPDQALALLRQWTGQDFGMDVDAWEAWLRANTAELRGTRPRTKPAAPPGNKPGHAPQPSAIRKS
jgi:hypothetical protein